jgi:hypothetical protein
MIYQTPDDRSNSVLNLRVCKNRFYWRRKKFICN